MRRQLLVGLALAAAAPTAGAAPPPTFARDVAPLLHRRCGGCHHPGEAAPMPLLTYAQARPWAKAIRDEVVARTMPPWFADPRYGRFANDPRLGDEEIATIVRWVEAGAPSGGRPPPPPRYSTRYQIGPPDLEVSLPAPVQVPARGELGNQYFTVPLGLGEDRWVSAVEIQPGNRAVVHHITLSLVAPAGSRQRVPPAMECSDEPFEAGAIRSQAGGDLDRPAGGTRQYLYSWTPGSSPFVAQAGEARFVAAGSKLVFEVHYAPNGKPTSDQSRVGLRFAAGPVVRRSTTVVATNEAIAIPPGAPNYQATACLVFTRPVTLRALKPHMHLRGRDMRFDLRLPDGARETLLFVPRWDFDWQLTYELAEPRAIPAGAHLDVTAHWDNSAGNKRNPDPTKRVVWDDQSTGEMLAGMITVVEPR